MNRFYSQTSMIRGFVCATLFTLAACGSDSSTPDAVDDISKIGVVNIADGMLDNTGELVMIFSETSQAVSVNSVIQELDQTKDVTEDSCEIAINAPEDTEDGQIFGLEGVTLAELNAGEVITVSSPAGSFAELRPSQVFGTLAYFNSIPVSSPFPSDLVFDIPGNEFPAVADVAVPNVEPFVLTSHTPDQDVALDFEFTWQAGASSDARIILYVDLTEGVGVTGTDGTSMEERRVQIDCVLLDDGSFVFSPAMQSQLADAGFDTLPMSIGRRATSTRRQGDALLIVQRSSGEL